MLFLDEVTDFSICNRSVTILADRAKVSIIREYYDVAQRNLDFIHESNKRHNYALQALQFGIVSNEGPEFRKCTITQILIPYSFELSTLIFFFIPMIVITILYIRIGLKLKSSAKLKERRASRPMLSSDHQQNSSQRLIAAGQPSRKILKMLGEYINDVYFTRKFIVLRYDIMATSFGFHPQKR
jgi:hypothetical protein